MAPVAVGGRWRRGSPREPSVRRTGDGCRCLVTVRIASWGRDGDPPARGSWAVGGARRGPSRPAGRVAAGGGPGRRRRDRVHGELGDRGGGVGGVPQRGSDRWAGRPGRRGDVDGDRRVRVGQLPTRRRTGRHRPRAGRAGRQPRAGARRVGRAIYQRRGLDEELARTVAGRLMAVDPLAAHVRDEFGLTEELLARPVQAAVVSAASFAVGAVLPLLAVVLAPASVRILVVAGVALVVLGMLGGVGGRLGGASPWGGGWSGVNAGRGWSGDGGDHGDRPAGRRGRPVGAPGLPPMAARFARCRR